MESDGRSKAIELFPTLDMIVGMGDKCSNGDAELLQFAAIADSLGKIYFTTRGPSAILQSEPSKKHFFSTHLNSDEYPTTSIQQFALRGLQTSSVISEDSGNAFFEGVGSRAVELLQDRAIALQVLEKVKVDPDPDWARVNQTVQWAIGNRSDVLILSLRTPIWLHVLDLLHEARATHVFKALWAVNIPWGNNCGGGAELCAHAVGASQMSSEEIEVYRDDLLGMTWVEFQQAPFFRPPPDGWVGTPFWDVGAITSVFVQAIQRFYRFRPLPYENFLRDAEEYEALRLYMREGSLIGNTFAGPTRFTEHGANAGRSPSTMQVSEEGRAQLVFPADIAVAGFVFPSPGSVPCPFNFYRDYSPTLCPLCPHQCVLCRNGTEWIETEVCGCSRGFWADEIVVGRGCTPCPDRAVCDGRDSMPYPQADTWGAVENPERFFECKTQRCRGGPEFACSQGFAGSMCEGTQSGWFSLGSGVRLECPAERNLQIVMHVALIAAVLLIFVVLNSVLANRFDSIDLFLDSMQRLAIVSNFWLRWPEQFAPLFTVLEIVLLDADLARPDCVMSWNFWFSFVSQKVLLLLIFVAIALPAVVSSLRIKRRHKVSWREVMLDDKYNAQAWNHAVSQCIDTLMMMYPTLAKNTLDTFTCRSLNGAHYLVADPNFQCYTAQHTSMVVVSGLLQPLLVFGLPLGSLYGLVRGTRHQTLHQDHNLQRFGVLYSRYEPPYLWWEGWRTLQKLLLVAIQVLLWQYPLLQANLALLLFLLGLASHYYAQPYASPVLDRMDSASYFVSCLFTMVGISFYSPETRWRHGLYLLTLAGLALYGVVAVLMSYYEVAERVSSEKAAQAVKRAATEHFAKLQAQAEEATSDECERRQLKRAGTKASLNTLIAEANEGLAELPATLDGHIFKRWTDTEEVTLEAYHSLKKLDQWLAPFVSDQSPTSQFSMLPEAELFRQINQVVPNLFTWIRRAPPEDMEALRRIVTSILANAQEQDEGFQDAIVPGDQSSVLYWLVNAAEPEERETFFGILELLISAQPVKGQRGDLESNFLSAQRMFSSKTSSAQSAQVRSTHSRPASSTPKVPACSMFVSTTTLQLPPSDADVESIPVTSTQHSLQQGAAGDGDRVPGTSGRVYGSGHGESDTPNGGGVGPLVARKAEVGGSSAISLQCASSFSLPGTSDEVVGLDGS